MSSLDVYLEAVKNESIPRFRFGVGGVTLFPPSAVGAEQRGYCGDDWMSSWLVIGKEDTCGDPIFVETTKVGLPVFTAKLGMGQWRPLRVADSLAQFLDALWFMAPYQLGREHPAGLAANPLTPDEVGRLEEGLGRILQDANLTAWREWLGIGA